LADVGFSDFGEGYECVFAEADEGEDGVEAVLVRAEGVDADCEGEDELEIMSVSEWLKGGIGEHTQTLVWRG
jgi:hypothetical protein